MSNAKYVVDRCGDSRSAESAAFLTQALWACPPTSGIQVTAKGQINALSRVGCDCAIREIKKRNDKPLSTNRLKHHLKIAVNEGYVYRAVVLSEMAKSPLSATQLARLIRRCLQLGWIVDALHAHGQGDIPAGVRRELSGALLNNGLANNQDEVEELLSQQ